jgi:cyclic pyranopterin phosphate synthase
VTEEGRKLTDTFGRRISYLRVSVTDRCNLRCQYCMPEQGIALAPASEVLRFEEIARVVRVGAGLGLERVRLTGGEPLVRRELPELVRQLSSVKGIGEVSLTTNGVLLAEQAPPLAAAGLSRVNVSLDTLSPRRYAELTRGGRLEQALAGVEAALAAGLRPVKINVVLQSENGDGKGDEADLQEFLALARRLGVEVRFIELMPFALNRGGFVPISWVREKLGRAADLEQPVKSAGGGPATSFRLKARPGRIGFIAPLSEPFCGSCNRLRLSATGRVRFCLFPQGELDLRPALRGRGSDAELASLLRAAAAAKPAGYPRGAELKLAGTMCQVGG